MLMDDQGLVLVLVATPPAPAEAKAAAESTANPLDWQAVLSDLGYGEFELQPAAPDRTPPVWADERRVFTGTWPGAPNLPVRLDAAADGGRLVWLDTAIDGLRPSASMVGLWESFRSRTSRGSSCSCCCRRSPASSRGATTACGERILEGPASRSRSC